MSKKKQKKKVLIGDQGVEEKWDIVGNIVVFLCATVIVSLVVLGIMAYF